MAALTETGIEDEESTMHTGWLNKRGETNKSFKNRFFVLSEEQLDYSLKYYSADTQKKEDLKGTVNVMEILELRDTVDEKRSMFGGPDPALRFDVVLKDRTYELLAPNAYTKTTWLAKLSSASGVQLSSSSGTDCVMAGQLLKLSGNKGTFDNRYFKLRNDDVAQTLAYYKSKDGSGEPQGTILLADVVEVREWSSETYDGQPGLSAEFSSRFELKTHGRVFVLAEAYGNLAAKKAWLSALTAACGVELKSEAPDASRHAGKRRSAKPAGGGEVFECLFNCGFKGAFEQVAAHEQGRSCRPKTDGAAEAE